MLVIPGLSWPILFGENHLHVTQALMVHAEPSIHFRHPCPSMSFRIVAFLQFTRRVGDSWKAKDCSVFTSRIDFIIWAVWTLKIRDRRASGWLFVANSFATPLVTFEAFVYSSLRTLIVGWFTVSRDELVEISTNFWSFLVGWLWAVVWNVISATTCPTGIVSLSRWSLLCGKSIW